MEKIEFYVEILWVLAYGRGIDVKSRNFLIYFSRILWILAYGRESNVLLRIREADKKVPIFH